MGLYHDMMVYLILLLLGCVHVSQAKKSFEKQLKHQCRKVPVHTPKDPEAFLEKFMDGSSLGKGSYGEVSEIKWDDGTIKAAKIIEMNGFTTSQNIQIQNEICAMWVLRDIPQVVSLEDVILFEEETPILIMDKYDMDLSDCMSSPDNVTKPLSCMKPMGFVDSELSTTAVHDPKELFIAPAYMKWVKHIIFQTLLGLSAIHHHDYVHMDIKPKNIMLTRATGDHNVHIIDFSLVRNPNQKRQPWIFGLGSPTYLAPELFVPLPKKLLLRHGGLEKIMVNPDLMETIGREAVLPPATLKADIYSLGVILYQLLTGSLPFNATKEIMNFPNSYEYYFTIANIHQNGEKLDIKKAIDLIYKGEEAQQLSDLLQGMLGPLDHRLSSHDVIHHPFFKDLIGGESHHPVHNFLCKFKSCF